MLESNEKPFYIILRIQVSRLSYSLTWVVRRYMFDQVMDPHLDGLIAHLERRLCEVGVVAAFGILGPQAATLHDVTAHTELRILADKFCSHVDFGTVLEEWVSFKEQVVAGPLKVT